MDSDHEITDSIRPSFASPVNGTCLAIVLCKLECYGQLPPSLSGLQVLDLLRGAQEGATGNGAFGPTTDPLLLGNQDSSLADDRQPNSSGDKPHFDEGAGELWFRGQVVRSYSPRGTNCLRVLIAFEEEGWPRRINDPLPVGKNAQRLSNTIRALNKNLSTIEFYAGGDGESFGWRVKN